MVIEETVPGVGGLLHVVVDSSCGEGPIEALRRSAQSAVLGSVGPDDGTRSGQEAFGVGVLWDRAVVDARRRKAVAGSEQQGESSAHAVPDDADRAGAALVVCQVRTSGVDVVE